MQTTWSESEWHERRKEAYARIEAERHEWLRGLTDEEAQQVVARIFSGPCPPPVPRETGLVERQRLFAQLR